MRVDIAPGEGRIRARLFEDGLVADEVVLEDGRRRLTIAASDAHLQRVCRELGIDDSRFTDTACLPADRSLQSGAATR